ncbi:MAG TPA: translocation/assembly module TamB domain-containing protein [Acetobacteraceae bacterium]|nr:translocation/assembly module TamB domain-containing protein [Acetobacteraceae bacterium]
MRRIAQWTGIVLAGIFGAVLVLLALVLLGANTDPGRKVLTWLVPRLTDGAVRVEGLSGAFPRALRVRGLTLADASGPYLSGRNVAVDWRPFRLLRGEVSVDRLTAAEIDFLRMPKSSSKSSGKPTPILIRAFAISRLDISPTLAGTAASLAVSGSLGMGADGTDALSLDASRLGDGGGTYRVTARLDPRTVSLEAHLSEPPRGLLATLAGLPDLGATRIDASLSGPRSAIATSLAVTAGPLSARARGKIDLAHKAADLAVDATAPAMQPRPGISWQSVSLHARVSGPFTTPQLAGNLDIEKLAAAGTEIARITAAIRGNKGEAHLDATLSGILLPAPGPARTLLAAAPLTLTADARLDAAGRPISFTIRHPLIAATGTVQTEGQERLAATITLPDLAPLASLGGIALKGDGTLKVAAAQHPDGISLSLAGGLGLTGGIAPIVPLLGPSPKFAFAGRLAGSTVSLSHFLLSGTALSLGAEGTASADKVALGWTASLKDLAAFGAGVKGTLDGKGTIAGPTTALAATADLTGRIGAASFAPAPVHAHLALRGLPAAPKGEVTAEGMLAGAPLRLALSAARAEGALTVAIHEAAWKSASAEGTLTLHGTAPSGKIAFSVKNLGDFSPLLGSPLRGSLSGSLASAAASGPPSLTLDLIGENLAASGAAVGHATLAGKILDPLGNRRIQARLALAGVEAGGVSGASAELSVNGPMSALAVNLTSAVPSFQHASLAASATLDTEASRVSLSALTASWRGATARLLAPARITYAPGLTIADLRLGMAGADFSVDGRLQPDLALSVTAHNITPTLIAPFAPTLHAEGRLDADARLSGTLAAPAGHLVLRGSGLGLASALTAGLPLATINATADLAGRQARLDANISAGSATHLTLAGTIPLSQTGPLGLTARGAVNLAVLDPILTAEGRRVEGTISLDGRMSGTVAKPVMEGTVRLSNAMLADYANGISIRDISGEIAASGDTIRIARFEGRAGPGTIAISGSVGAFAPDLPVNLVITARNAELPQSDLMTARFDSDLAIRGDAGTHLAASGTVRIRRAEIRIPASMPPSIAVLHVVRAGTKPPPPPAPGPNVALDITVSAAREVFVRGRGIDTEFGGRIHISGTAADPIATGNFTMVRGELSLAGKTLVFSDGTIGFNGASPENPTLDLVASNTTATTTSTLTIGGTAEAPTVTLSSSPVLPQDQVLANLFFGGSSSLSPFQLAELANSLTTLTGTGPSTGDPLAALRSGLGLDQLTVGSDAAGNPTLQAGRYIAPGVYVGANQSTYGGGSQAEVEINLTKQLQLDASVGAGTTNATGASSTTGTSVGLTYQFQY